MATRDHEEEGDGKAFFDIRQDDAPGARGSSVSLSAVICDFLQVAIQLILYARGIYPPSLFERRRYYNVVVAWARHPELREYVTETVGSLRAWLEQGVVTKLAVVLRDSSGKTRERFVFNLQLGEGLGGSAAATSELEFCLRSCLMKLVLADSLLKPLPAGCTWDLVAYARVFPGLKDPLHTQWLPAERPEIDSGVGITPLRSFAATALKMQLYVEQEEPTVAS